jgi:predicted small lipoprotein YifL
MRSMTLPVTVLVLVASLAIAACGKKGDPEPPDANSKFPNQYPTAQPIPETGTTQPSPSSGQQAPTALTPFTSNYP